MPQASSLYLPGPPISPICQCRHYPLRIAGFLSGSRAFVAGDRTDDVRGPHEASARERRSGGRGEADGYIGARARRARDPSCVRGQPGWLFGAAEPERIDAAGEDQVFGVCSSSWFVNRVPQAMGRRVFDVGICWHSL